MVAGAERIGGRIEQRQHPAALVAVQEAPGDGQRGQAQTRECAQYLPGEAGEEDDVKAGRAHEGGSA